MPKHGASRDHQEIDGGLWETVCAWLRAQGPENPASFGPFCASCVWAHPRAFEDLHEHGEPALHFVHCQLVLMQGNCAAAQLLLQNMARAQAFQLRQTFGTLICPAG